MRCARQGGGFDQVESGLEKSRAGVTGGIPARPLSLGQRKQGLCTCRANLRRRMAKNWLMQRGKWESNVVPPDRSPMGRHSVGGRGMFPNGRGRSGNTCDGWKECAHVAIHHREPALSIVLPRRHNPAGAKARCCSGVGRRSPSTCDAVARRANRLPLRGGLGRGAARLRFIYAALKPYINGIPD
jgi:hypothetical protein